MDDQPAPVDLNTASLEELITLPGIGPAIAERILEKRPFTSLENLRRVSGLSEAALERLQPLVTLSPAVPADKAEAELEGQASTNASPEVGPAKSSVLEAGAENASQPAEIETTPLETLSDESVAPEEVRTKPVEGEVPELPLTPEPTSAATSVITPTPVTGAKTPPRPISRIEALWLALGALIIATLLGSVLSLGFLALINGGLSYARPSQINEISRQIDGMNTEADILQQDMDALRARIDNLEALSGRVGAVEKAIDGVREDIGTIQTQVDTLDRQLGELNGTVSELQTRTNRFQGFLDGLRKLVEGIFKP